MKLNFHVDPMFQAGIARLAVLLHFEQDPEGVPVYAVCGDRIGAALSGGIGTIYYQKKHHFFRELGVFIENAKKSDTFDITEDDFFQTMCAQFSASNAAPPHVEGAKELMDHLAVMGYNMITFYTEDTIELKSRPYFGLFRGRYTQEELREMDDYAFDYGMELLPCIECCGHMSSYLRWPEAAPIKDTSSVLLAREEKTFEFLDELIKTVSGCLRSRRININMDETHDIGRGAFLKKHGYLPREQIFHEFVARVVQITKKYGLTPMVASDMYFRFQAEDGWQYYDKNIVIPEETKRAIPEEVQLIYWHYGEEPHCDEYMIEKHLDIGRDIIFDGGVWDWGGLFPENNYAYEATEYSLRACRKYGVREMIMCSWASVYPMATMLGFSMAAELCYGVNPSKQQLKDRFFACTEGDYDAFMRMSNYHNKFGEGEVYPDFNQRFLGRALFWQDILEGLYDKYLWERPMSDYYQENAEQMKQYHGKFEELYRFAEKVFEYLAVKTRIAENLVPAYLADDRKTLAKISQELLPALKDLVTVLRPMHRAALSKSAKLMVQWKNMDNSYGGMAARCETAKTLIDAYLAGTIHRIDELEEPHLIKPVGPFVTINV